MNALISAIQFLTTLRVSSKYDDGRHLPASAAYFPVVGFILGGIYWVCAVIFFRAGFGQVISSVFIVIISILLTRAMHLDGLADSVDALFSGKDRERMLNIMRDPHIGTMGVTAIVSSILIKVAILSSISHTIFPASVLLMAVLSRWSMVLAINSFPYARDEGKGSLFFKGRSIQSLVIASAITALISYIYLGINGIFILIAVAITTYIAGKVPSRMIGGITGDILGAINELSECTVLLIIYALI